MATLDDAEDFGDDDLDSELEDTSDDDQEVDVGVDDEDGDDEVTADVENLMRQAGPSLSARRRVENYLEMKRAARDLSELEDFDFD